MDINKHSGTKRWTKKGWKSRDRKKGNRNNEKGGQGRARALNSDDREQ